MPAPSRSEPELGRHGKHREPFRPSICAAMPQQLRSAVSALNANRAAVCACLAAHLKHLGTQAKPSRSPSSGNAVKPPHPTRSQELPVLLLLSEAELSAPSLSTSSSPAGTESSDLPRRMRLAAWIDEAWPVIAMRPLYTTLRICRFLATDNRERMGVHCRERAAQAHSAAPWLARMQNRCSASCPSARLGCSLRHQAMERETSASAAGSGHSAN